MMFSKTKTYLSFRRGRLDRGVNFRVEFRPVEVGVVLLEQQLARLLVEGRLGVGDDQEALDHHEDVPDAHVGLPVFLQCVDTNLS